MQCLLNLIEQRRQGHFAPVFLLCTDSLFGTGVTLSGGTDFIVPAYGVVFIEHMRVLIIGLFLLFGEQDFRGGL